MGSKDTVTKKRKMYLCSHSSLRIMKSTTKHKEASVKSKKGKEENIYFVREVNSGEQNKYPNPTTK